MEWQPIETFPQEPGEVVLLYNSDERVVNAGFWSCLATDHDNGWWEVSGCTHWYKGDVTHWMPLPKAPK